MLYVKLNIFVNSNKLNKITQWKHFQKDMAIFSPQRF